MFPDPTGLMLMFLGTFCIGMALGLFTGWWNAMRRRPATHVGEPRVLPEPVSRPPWRNEDGTYNEGALAAQLILQDAIVAEARVRQEKYDRVQDELMEAANRLGLPAYKLEALRSRIAATELALAEIQRELGEIWSFPERK